VAAHQVVRVRPVKVTLAAAQAQELMRGLAVVVARALWEMVDRLTKVVMVVRGHPLQLPDQQSPARVVVVVTTLTARRAQVARVAAVKAHNTHRGQMLLAVLLTPVAGAVVEAVEAVAQAAVGQVSLPSAISAHNA
jgi:hypothetical protein